MMKRTLMFMCLCAALALISGCGSAQAACPGVRCASVGVWSPWGGVWYYQSPCAGGRCDAKPKAEGTETAKGVEESDHFREAAKMVVEEPAEPEVADTAPEIVEFKPFCVRVAELVNAQRKALGLPALELDESLCQGCDSHSAYMARNGFGHAYYGGRECIAYGVRSPEAVVNMWLGSSGHRAILLGSGRILGVGCSGTYWTLRVR